MKQTALILSLLGLGLSLNTACQSTADALKGARATAQQAVLSLPPSQNPTADITSALEKLKTYPAFRIESYSPDAPGKGIDDYIAPDRHHRYSASGGGTETIVIGKDWYTKQEGKAWEKSELFSLKDLGWGLDFAKPQAGKAARYLQAEMTDGLATRVYEYETGVEKTISKTKLWVRVSDGLPHKFDIFSQLEGTNIRIIAQCSYPQNLKIEPPI